MKDWKDNPALVDMQLERIRQDAKWGVQRHPDGTGAPSWAEIAQMAKSDCARAVKNGNLTWRQILLEEIYEAFTEKDAARLREELIQSGAVIAAWVEAIDSRSTHSGEPPRCSRCRALYLDGAICPGSGYSLPCVTPDELLKPDDATPAPKEGE